MPQLPLPGEGSDSGPAPGSPWLKIEGRQSGSGTVSGTKQGKQGHDHTVCRCRSAIIADLPDFASHPEQVIRVWMTTQRSVRASQVSVK